MKTAIVTLGEIVKHPIGRLDAEYHVGKRYGKKAFKVEEGGMLVEDDVKGKVMLIPDEAVRFNETKAKIDVLESSIADVRNVISKSR